MTAAIIATADSTTIGATASVETPGRTAADIAADSTDVDRSSSPAASLFGSPHRHHRMVDVAMGKGVRSLGLGNPQARAASEPLDALSPATSQSAGTDEDDVNVITAQSSKARGRRVQAALSDIDSDGSESGGEDGGGSDQPSNRNAFLATFRQRFANEQGAAGSDGPAASSIFSGSLSDPPTTSSSNLSLLARNNNVPNVAVGMPTSTSSSPPSSGSMPASPSPRKLSKGRLRAVTAGAAQVDEESAAHASRTAIDEAESSSPYITEEKKRVELAGDPDARKARVRQLAARAREQRRLQSAGNGDNIDMASSSSELELDGETMTHAIAQARVESDRRKKGKETTKRKAHGSKALQLEPDDLTSDSDAEVQIPGARTSAPKPLSKKELDKMNQMRARVEREAKVRQAKDVQERGPRPIFGLKDLLSNIGTKEAANIGSSKPKSQSLQREASPSSDPIESSGSENDNGGHRVKGSTHTSKEGGHIPFFIKMKEKMASSRNSPEEPDSDKERLPEASVYLHKALDEQKKKAARLLTLQQRKEEAIRRATAERLTATDEANDDIELYMSEENEAGKSKIKTAQYSSPYSASSGSPMRDRARQQSRFVDQQGSPGRGQKHPMLLANDESSIGGTQRTLAGPIFDVGRDSAVQQGKLEGIQRTNNKAAQQRAGKHAAKPRLNKAELEAIMAERIRKQNILLRQKKRAMYGKANASEDEPSAQEKREVGDILRELQDASAAQNRESSVHESGDDDDSEYNPDGSNDAAEAEQIDYGSASEAAASDDDDEQLALSDSESSLRQAEDLINEEQVRPSTSRRTRAILDEEEDASGAQGIKLPAEEALNVQEVENLASNADRNVVAIEASDEAPNRLDISPEHSPVLGPNTDVAFSQFFTDTQVPVELREPAPAPRITTPNMNASLGQFFFEGTQSDAPPQSDNFAVLAAANNQGGFTQLFEQGTSPSDTDRVRMPPPSTSAKGLSLLRGSGEDAFSALREAQQAAAHNVADDPVDLPSLDGAFNAEEIEDMIAMENEAIRADEEDRLRRMEKQHRENNVTYLNKDGFFTQTKPDDMSFLETQSQSQSQNLYANETVELGPLPSSQARASDQALSGIDVTSPAQTKRRRFRLAARVQDDEGISDHDDDTRENRLRLSDDARHENDRSDSETESDESETLVASKSAFDALREGARSLKNAKGDVQHVRRFLEGEAEESDGDSEEGDPKGKGRNRGGLGGVFSDEEQRSDEDDDDSEDDGKDLEGLIDEEKDEDEAEKDVLARERYLRDLDEDEKAAIALHEKAVRGDFRSKRRARNEDGTLGGFLDDDYEDDWLEKKARNPYGNIAKKRRLQGKDGMDALLEDEESQAFVVQYRDSHRAEDEVDKYTFLQPTQDDEETMRSLYDQDGGRIVEDGEDDDSQSGAEPPQRLTRQELQDELAVRRRKKRQMARGVFAEDDAEAEEMCIRQEQEEQKAKELQRIVERAVLPDWSDDDEPAYIRDHLGSRVEVGQRADAGRAQHSAVLTTTDAADEVDEEGATTAFGLQGLGTSRLVSERERTRLQRLAKDFEHEPDWANAHLSRVRGAGGAARTTSRSASSSSLAGSNAGGRHGSGRSGPAVTRKPTSRVSSKLRGVMSRQSQFSAEQQAEAERRGVEADD